MTEERRTWLEVEVVVAFHQKASANAEARNQKLDPLEHPHHVGGVGGRREHA